MFVLSIQYDFNERSNAYELEMSTILTETYTCCCVCVGYLTDSDFLCRVVSPSPQWLWIHANWIYNYQKQSNIYGTSWVCKQVLSLSLWQHWHNGGSSRRYRSVWFLCMRQTMHVRVSKLFFFYLQWIFKPSQLPFDGPPIEIHLFKIYSINIQIDLHLLMCQAIAYVSG